MKLGSITVRRHQANDLSSSHDFVVRGHDAMLLDSRLRDLLRVAQAERGKGVWSTRDPEVWAGETFVGRLEPGGDAADLIRRAMRALSS